MIRTKWQLPREELPNLKLLQALVWSHRPAFHAVIGLDEGNEVVAVADAIREYIMGWQSSAGETPVGRVRCFHYGHGILPTRKLIRRLDRMGKRQGRNWLLRDIVSFVAAGHDYAGWRQAVEDWTPFGLKFGLVVYAGGGKSEVIRSRLMQLMPMMDHRTAIVLCRMHMPHIRARFHAMLYKGWDGVRFGDLGILRRLARPKVVKG
jgi:hypothetical protein